MKTEVHVLKHDFIVIWLCIHFDSQGKVPDPEPGCDSQAVDAANSQWQSVVSSQQVLEQPVIVNMNDILSFSEWENHINFRSMESLYVLGIVCKHGLLCVTNSWPNKLDLATG